MSEKKVGVGFGVMLSKNGKVLLGKRYCDPEKSVFKSTETWTFPGGKLDYGESFEDGAKRELLEETGIELEKVKVICVSNDKNEHAHYVTIGMFSEYFKGEPKVMEPEEITEWKWFDLNNLPNPLYFSTKNLIQNYLNKKFYLKRD